MPRNASTNRRQGARSAHRSLHRGSHKRINRIKWRNTATCEVWILVAVVLFVLFVALPWLTTHPYAD